MSEANSQNTSVAAVPAKSFMTAGPTLHYSHTNVLWFWGLSIIVFLLACYFWNLLMPHPPESEKGISILLDPAGMWDILAFRLGEIVKNPISIYEYPWHIIVLGILMGILAVAPVLVSQLLSFRFSIPLVLSIIVIAKLYLFGIFVLISCVAVACRPLRFRSRFVSLALCMAPQLIYWAMWGGSSTPDPVRWGFSFAPWIYAWISGLLMAAIVLGIGHFTRYKPGLNWLTCLVFLAVAFGVFQRCIGFAELDYHRYVAGNDPEEAVEFHEQPLSETLDKVIEDTVLRSLLEGQFYPKESNQLRDKLKEDVQSLLSLNRWPEWFRRKMPNELKYQLKWQRLMTEYDKFIERWPGNETRMPTALYFKAILSEFHPDIRFITSHEQLRFYNDYPFGENILKWQELYNEFAESPESIEARWRLAMDLAGQGKFETADTYCQVARDMIAEQLKLSKEPVSNPKESDSIFAVFQKPQPTVMTPFKLNDLDRRFEKLQMLISEENRGDDEEAKNRLAEFVMLNPYDLNYVLGLEGLLEKMPENDSLRDNVLFEKAMRTDDLSRRDQLLTDLVKQFSDHDVAIEARYELGRVKIQLSKQEDLSETQKEELLTEARSILLKFIEDYPQGPFTQHAQAALLTLPKEE